MKSGLPIFACSALALIATPVVAAPPAGSVHITSVSYGGTGCPQGSVGTFLSDDASTLTTIFDSFIVAFGSGVSVTESRKNCQVNFFISVPDGYQFSFDHADMRGYASLLANQTLTWAFTKYFPSSTNQTSWKESIFGPIDADYLITGPEQTGTGTPLFSPCGGNITYNMNSQVRGSGPSGPSGIFPIDGPDTKETYVQYFNWASC